MFRVPQKGTIIFTWLHLETHGSAALDWKGEFGHALLKESNRKRGPEIMQIQVSSNLGAPVAPFSLLMLESPY